VLCPSGSVACVRSPYPSYVNDVVCPLGSVRAITSPGCAGS